PDIGVSRSFPRPNQDEHHFGTRPTIEFNVRIPRSQLPPDALSRVRLTLYRLPDPSPKNIVGMVNKHFGDQARVVASVEGLRDEHLAGSAREQIRRLFPSSFATSKEIEMADLIAAGSFRGQGATCLRRRNASRACFDSGSSTSAL